MRLIVLHIESFFWLFLIIGIATGLTFPFDKEISFRLIKPLLMLLMFAVFLKSDMNEVFKHIKNVRKMLFLVVMYMIIIPAIFFILILPFNPQMAVAALLLVAMPTAMAAPVITDILNGNKELAASMSVLTSLTAPFSVSFLFWWLGRKVVIIDLPALLLDVLMFIFIPLLLSQLFKRVFKERINRNVHLLSALNILLLSLVVYMVISAHRAVFLKESIGDLAEKTIYVYMIFIALYILGYALGFKENNKGRIATAVNAAYMNNGMAIVLASLYFNPYVLTIAVLSELPWNTLPAVFKKANIVMEQFNKALTVKRG